MRTKGLTALSDSDLDLVVGGDDFSGGGGDYGGGGYSGGGGDYGGGGDDGGGDAGDYGSGDYGGGDAGYGDGDGDDAGASDDAQEQSADPPEGNDAQEQSADPPEGNDAQEQSADPPEGNDAQEQSADPPEGNDAQEQSADQPEGNDAQEQSADPPADPPEGNDAQEQPADPPEGNDAQEQSADPPEGNDAQEQSAEPPEGNDAQEQPAAVTTDVTEPPDHSAVMDPATEYSHWAASASAQELLAAATAVTNPDAGVVDDSAVMDPAAEYSQWAATAPAQELLAGAAAVSSPDDGAADLTSAVDHSAVMDPAAEYNQWAATAPAQELLAGAAAVAATSHAEGHVVDEHGPGIWEPGGLGEQLGLEPAADLGGWTETQAPDLRTAGERLIGAEARLATAVEQRDAAFGSGIFHDPEQVRILQENVDLAQRAVYQETLTFAQATAGASEEAVRTALQEPAMRAEADRVAAAWADGRNVVGFATPGGLASEGSPIMQALGLSPAVQQFGGYHDVQAASVAAGYRDDPTVGYAIFETAVAGAFVAAAAERAGLPSDVAARLGAIASERLFNDRFGQQVGDWQSRAPTRR